MRRAKARRTAGDIRKGAAERRGINLSPHRQKRPAGGRVRAWETSHEKTSEKALAESPFLPQPPKRIVLTPTTVKECPERGQGLAPLVSMSCHVTA